MASRPVNPSRVTGMASHGPNVRYPDSRNDQVTTNTAASVRIARSAHGVASGSTAAPASWRSGPAVPAGARQPASRFGIVASWPGTAASGPGHLLLLAARTPVDLCRPAGV